MKSTSLLAIFAVSVTLCTAATPGKKEPAETQQQRQEKFDEAIRARKIMVGMTADQVVRAWGEPSRKNSHGIGDKAWAQWVYPRSREETQYVYFKAGKVESWGKSERRP